MKFKMALSGILFLCVLLLASTSAYAIGTIVAYGDSLTDNGTSNIDPFGIMRFTDGDVWVETLANSMGSNLYDVAYGGATTGWDNPAAGYPILGLQWQLANTWPLSTFDMEDTLFTVWAGANDLFNQRSPFAAALNVGLALDNLATAGATSILVPNLPDIGLTPDYYYAGAEASAFASAWTLGFNTTLAGVMTQFELLYSDIDLYHLDIYGIFSDYIQVDDNGNITNIAEWKALFWDGVHPTSIGHEMIASAAYETLHTAPVPEPSTIVLMGLGLIGLARYSRRRAKQ